MLPLATACGSSHSIRRLLPARPASASLEAARPASNQHLLVAGCSADDPVQTLIGTADRHFKAGQSGARTGAFRGRRSRSSTAPSTCCSSRPYGARTEPRIREHFDRLVDRISAYEVQSAGRRRRLRGEEIRAGDDRRAAGTVDDPSAPPAAPPELKDAVQSPISRHRPRHPHSLQSAGPGLHRAVPGPAPRLHRGRDEARQQVSADDSERVPRRRAAARPRVRAARRKRLQARTRSRRRRPRASGSSWPARRSETACGATGHIDERSDPERRRSRRRNTCGRWPDCSTATGTWPSRHTTVARAACIAARNEARRRGRLLEPGAKLRSSCPAKPANTSR